MATLGRGAELVMGQGGKDSKISSPKGASSQQREVKSGEGEAGARRRDSREVPSMAEAPGSGWTYGVMGRKAGAPAFLGV